MTQDLQKIEIIGGVSIFNARNQAIAQLGERKISQLVFLHGRSRLVGPAIIGQAKWTERK